MGKPNLAKIPHNPGAYFFRDKRGRILYIGKAANLRNRLKSYSTGKPDNPRITKLIEEATSVSWQTVDSEIEALILESQLIKKHRPPFNVMLRDDKQYFYVGFSKDDFPKVIVTHRPESYLNLKIPNFKFQISNEIQNPKLKKDWGLGTRNWKFHSARAEWLGPFTDGGALRTTLRLLRRIFPFCTCKQKHNNYCLNYHIGKCPGFCCLKENQISNIKNRSTQSVECSAEHFSQKCSGQNGILKFKNEYKKNIKAIKEILSGKRAGLIKKLEKEMGVLAKKEDFEKAASLRDKIEKLQKIFANARILRNTNLQMRANATNKDEGTIDILKKILKLLRLPRRIEGYDVANIQGKFAVGAMVVFVNGRPDKSQYRKFKISNDKFQMTNQAQNPNDKSKIGDTGMLSEILTRRFNHTEWPRPDLIIVDGGKAQLNVTKHITRNMEHGEIIPIIALTKDEKHRGHHIYLTLPNLESSNLESSQDSRLLGKIPLSKLPPEVRNLILKIDQESHRFAIAYYRKLHRTHNTEHATQNT